MMLHGAGQRRVLLLPAVPLRARRAGATTPSSAREGRIENFGDEPGHCVVRSGTAGTDYNPVGRRAVLHPTGTSGSHGGADPAIVAEFVRYVRDGGAITTSPIAARYSVAAGALAAESLRNGNAPRDIPPVPAEAAEYFATA